MRDLLASDMLRFRRIEDTFRRHCLSWGYQEVRTPTLEYLHLFTATGTLTPGRLGKVYSFLDWDGWSGERVVLRPDGTIPVARLYIDNLSGEKVARLFYVTNIFSFEETGKEDRERWQCGAEFFGGIQLAADAEIILMAREIITSLGLERFQLQLSHAGLVKALIKEFKLSPGDEAKLTSRILEGDWQALKLLAESPEVSETSRLLFSLFSLKGKSSSFLHNLRALSSKASQDFKSSLDEFINIATLLDNLNCSYQIDITAMSGFEYYTGICFQFTVNGQKIAGGGRYDKLVPLMNGKDIPACGFALYVDTVARLLPLEQQNEVKVLVKGKNSLLETIGACFILAESLRKAGYQVELDFTDKEESGVRWVVLVSGEGAFPFLLRDHEEKVQRGFASMAEILKALPRK
jgi:histidyl-tRNA synthetase